MAEDVSKSIVGSEKEDGKENQNEDEYNPQPISIGCVEEGESTLLGKVVSNMEEAYDLYNTYAKMNGFAIRKGRKNESVKTNVVLTRQFVCTQEGKKRESISIVKYKRGNNRSGCMAELVLKITKGGMYEVTKHVMAHTHVLTTIKETHILRSHRHVPEQHVSQMKDMVKSGMTTADAYRYLREQVQGSPYLGFTSRDAYNALGIEKKIMYPDGDAQSLIDKLIEAQKSDPLFFYAIKVDHENHLESVFWRDRQMKEDYLTFGDLLVFDTTFGTNKYELICAPFVSMNHHRRNLLVGCGFVRKENISNFVWLFNTFKASMDDVEPQTIMTDQDAAMGNSISQCFLTTRHRLCTWHISENSKKRINHLRMKGGFTDLFDYVLRRCDTTDEFNHAWKRLMDKYNCHDNEWLMRLYTFKEKWCPALGKDKFSGGVLSSQRSESLNSCISKQRCASSGLMECYDIFCDVIKEWRRNERDDNVRDKKGYPDTVLPDCSILEHAKTMYTFMAYQTFEEQYKRSEGCKQKLQSAIETPNGTEYTYYVWQKRHHEFTDYGFVVRYRDTDNQIICECKHFEGSGFLCCHALRVMNVHSVDKISDCYYLKRWTRLARPETENDDTHTNFEKTGFVPDIWNVTMFTNFKAVTLECVNNPRTREICEKAFKNFRNEVELEIGKVDIPTYINEEQEGRSSKSVLDPVSTRKKGQKNKRTKSMTEKISNKKKREGKCKQNKEQSEGAPQSQNEPSETTQFGGQSTRVTPTQYESTATTHSTQIEVGSSSGPLRLSESDMRDIYKVLGATCTGGVGFEAMHPHADWF